MLMMVLAALALVLVLLVLMLGGTGVGGASDDVGGVGVGGAGSFVGLLLVSVVSGWYRVLRCSWFSAVQVKIPTSTSSNRRFPIEFCPLLLSS